MIARIVLGSISPCLHFSALPPINRDSTSQFVSLHEFHAHTKDCALEPNYLKARESAKSSKISRAVSSFRYSKLERRAAAIYTEGRTLTRILLYIKHISDKLLEHVKANSNLVAMSTTISRGSERTSTVPH